MTVKHFFTLKLASGDGSVWITVHEKVRSKFLGLVVLLGLTRVVKLSLWSRRSGGRLFLIDGHAFESVAILAFTRLLFTSDCILIHHDILVQLVGPTICSSCKPLTGVPWTNSFLLLYSIAASIVVCHDQPNLHWTTYRLLHAFLRLQEWGLHIERGVILGGQQVLIARCLI